MTRIDALEDGGYHAARWGRNQGQWVTNERKVSERKSSEIKKNKRKKSKRTEKSERKAREIETNKCICERTKNERAEQINYWESERRKKARAHSVWNRNE